MDYNTFSIQNVSMGSIGLISSEKTILETRKTNFWVIFINWYIAE